MEAIFAQQALQLSEAQEQLGKLASSNTKNKHLRTFARAISQDQEQTQKELKKILGRKGTELEPGVSAQFQEQLGELGELRNSKFDRAFKEKAVSVHEMSIRAYEEIIDHGEDPEIKAFALKTLPDLRQHLEIARNLPVSFVNE